MNNQRIKELNNRIKREQNIEEENDEEEIAPIRYDITSYGIDFDVEGIVNRIKRGDIFIPEFQRRFIWKMPESSRFIESLLLGLPVPGIFLAQESQTNKMFVIDGQQRLLSLKYFYDGYFNPKEESSTKRVFKLTKVQKEYDKMTHDNLKEKDKVNLNNSVIHATVVKQVSPSDDDTSIYHIFERLNSGGRKLTAQEIRTAVYHGYFVNFIRDLNEYETWRKVFGVKNDRMRDHELIIRFFAMFETVENYKKPMVDFLNIYTSNNRNIANEKAEKLSSLFKKTIDLFFNAIKEKLFRPFGPLNVALYESAMIGLAFRITKEDKTIEREKIQNAYSQLINNEDFKELLSQSTTDSSNVTSRIEKSKTIFMEA